MGAAEPDGRDVAEVTEAGEGKVVRALIYVIERSTSAMCTELRLIRGHVGLALVWCIGSERI